ncbi:Myb-like DNA-binding domain [Chloropicon primus]|uniref:Uncharacterized protein n=1 Tax=Chloropicon primus TaxID=1764295 RepID=A0A5B8MHS6_9CHLO|nr:hypothetical protein A3770_03p21420 [Chloropicon primus]UPQ98836.1 Myb-like DNA-binding domain [Chloropicon primus]|mmetsp:Transcript_5137/g.15440  ORF Transcript_5137/g.15440 Transcript_5137/m.15440 type:complete len:453 (-) Transcript_5137:39-1397(-)|eukprot:QDZ19624.1 hypothetical protein A3770_03p21420 [Chloropicon primus]
MSKKKRGKERQEERERGLDDPASNPEASGGSDNDVEVEVHSSPGRSEAAGGEGDEAATVDEGGYIVYKVSKPLRKVIGKKKCTRKKACALVWKYVLKNNLLHDGKVKQDRLLDKVFNGHQVVRSGLHTVVRPHLSVSRSSGSGGQDHAALPVSAQEETWQENKDRNSGKRSGPFSVQEDEIIRNKVREVALAQNLSMTDFSWIFAPKKSGYKKRNGLWSQIARCLPERTFRSVYDHGKRLFNVSHGCSGEMGMWSKEDQDELKKAVERYGSHKWKWKKISNVVGRPQEACRQHWNKVLSVKKKRVKWTDEEERKLKEIVGKFLADRARSEIESQPARRRQKEDIPWKKIALDHNCERTGHQCMQKWYGKLRPSMVTVGEWGNGQDKVLLNKLTAYKGKSDWEVDWETIVPGRNAIQAKKRWNLMRETIPDYRDRSFTECIEFLREKFAKHLS